MKLKFIGHSCFLLEYKEYKILIDPFITGNPNINLDPLSIEANYILVSHGHSDHVGDSVEISKKNSAKISPLVIKASAGTLFKLPIYFCNTLDEVLKELKETKIYLLSSHAKNSVYDLAPCDKSIFVLGNESNGVSPEVQMLCNDSLKIPMNRGVESLNVAVTASIIAFMK